MEKKGGEGGDTEKEVVGKKGREGGKGIEHRLVSD